MKRIVLTLIVAAATSASFAQGLISMNTQQGGGYLAFYDTVAGARATDASVGLYWRVTSDIDASGAGWTLVGPTAMTTGAAQNPNSVTWGMVNAASGGGNRDLGPYGQTLYFQLRAWTGGYATWEAAVSSGNANALYSLIVGAGSAPVVQATTQTSSTVPAPTIMWGGTGASPVIVNMVPVPEPSTIALAGLGLLGLLFIRRRK